MKKDVSFFRKVFLILLCTIITLLVLYFIQSVVFINSGKVDLWHLINNSYRSETNNYQLSFNSEESLTLYCPESPLSQKNESFILDIEVEGEVLIAKNEEKTFVFIPVSEDRIFLQTRDVMLYNAEYIKALQEQQNNEAVEEE